MAFALVTGQDVSANAATATFANTPTNGNLMVCVAGCRGSGTLTAPSGWSTAKNDAADSTNPGIAVFYKVAGAGENKTVTYTTTGTGLFIAIYEYSGQAATPLVDTAVTATGSSTSPRSGTLTSSFSDNLLLSTVFLKGSTSTFSSWINSFTERDSVQTGSGGAASRCAVADLRGGGSVNSGCTTTSNNWRCTQVAFAAAGSTTNVALSGQAATASAGTAAPTNSEALSGQSSTASPGTASPATSQALNGVQKLYLTATTAPITVGSDLTYLLDTAPDGSTFVTTTAGTSVRLTKTAGGTQVTWVAAPFGTGFTLGPLLIADLLAFANGTTNATISIAVLRLDGSGNVLSTVATLSGLTVNNTTEQEKSFSSVVVSTAFNAGDRLGVQITYLGGSMIAGKNITVTSAEGTRFEFNGTSPALGILAPSASFALVNARRFYLTSIPSAVAFGTDTTFLLDEKPDGTTFVTATVNGPVPFPSPSCQVTDTSGGNRLSWLSASLDAFTLNPQILWDILASVSSNAAHATVNIIVSLCDSVGTLKTSFPTGASPAELTTNKTTLGDTISGITTQVQTGDRLLVQLYLDDGSSNMVAGQTVTVYSAFDSRLNVWGKGFARGSVAVDRSASLTGSNVGGSSGAVAVADSVPLTGSSVGGSPGAFTPTSTPPPLVGLAATVPADAILTPVDNCPLRDWRVFFLASDTAVYTGICLGPDDAMWTVDGNNGAVVRVVADGTFTLFPLASNSFPQSICLGPDGNLWFTESGLGKIGRITPLGVITEFAAPDPGATPQWICAGPDGALWFTDGDGHIGRMTTAGVLTNRFAGLTDVAQAICAGPDGNVWFVEPGPNLVGKITPGGVVTEFAIPTAGTGPSAGICLGPDGNLWFTEVGASQIGSVTTAGVLAEFACYRLPAGICAGPDGALWICSLDLNGLGRMTVAGDFTAYDAVVDAGALPAPDAAGNIWFVGNSFVVGYFTPQGPTAQGDLAPATAVPLDGLDVTAPGGSLSPSPAIPLTGQDAGAGSGSLGPADAVPLVGEDASSETGSATAASSLALAGQQIAVEAGGVLAQLLVALDGLLTEIDLGTLTPFAGSVIDQPLTGLEVGMDAGAVSVLVARGLAGAAATTQAGALSPVLVNLLDGETITAEQGNVGAGLTLLGIGVSVSAGLLGVLRDTGLGGLTIGAVAGTLKATNALPLVGIDAATLAIGDVAAAHDRRLAGLVVAAAPGLLRAELTLAVAGTAVTAAQGAFTVRIYFYEEGLVDWIEPARLADWIELSRGRDFVEPAHPATWIEPARDTTWAESKRARQFVEAQRPTTWREPTDGRA